MTREDQNKYWKFSSDHRNDELMKFYKEHIIDAIMMFTDFLPDRSLSDKETDSKNQIYSKLYSLIGC